MKLTGWARSVSDDNAVYQELEIVLFDWVTRNLSELLLTLRNCVGAVRIRPFLVPETKNRGCLKKQSGNLL